MNAPAAALVGVAYLLGSISFAVLLVRLRTGRDIRTEGSGNAGATNVARAHGKALGIAVALLDVAKGAGAVLLMRTVTADPRYTAAAGLAAIVGHVFPIFYGFRGGKGVATAIGAFLVLAPLPTLVCAVVFLLVVLVTRYVSLGSVLAMVLLPPVAGALFHAPRPIVAAAAGAAVLIVIKHRDNLRRLARGEERRFGTKGPGKPPGAGP
ncbi:MAG TPA: glycerol-3-phosphate 1-O-acyltransferase PlsY [Thermoanaerobaculia bacterium]|jgi:glycerol-3-phosphate acyltransferase PlsY